MKIRLSTEKHKRVIAAVKEIPYRDEFYHINSTIEIYIDLFDPVCQLPLRRENVEAAARQVKQMKQSYFYSIEPKLLNSLETNFQFHQIYGATAVQIQHAEHASGVTK